MVHTGPHRRTVRCLMATKPRYEKSPIQLWIVDNRRERNMTPADIARLTGVTEATARGWESRGRPSDEALAVLERHFGVKAPADRSADYTELAQSVGSLIIAIRELVDEMRADRFPLRAENGSRTGPSNAR